MKNRLIQLTDLHIGSESEDTYGIRVRDNFTRILSVINEEEKFDHLIISGDLCFRDPDRGVYSWIKAEIEKVTQYYSIIPGNHDDNSMINAIFYQRTSEKLYDNQNIADENILFLDSSQGFIDNTQLEYLKTVLSAHTDRQIIFMHHPPAICNVPHMDRKYLLQNYYQFQEIIFSSQKPVYIFCGHYHIDKSVHIRNMHLFICPSTFFQIDDRSEEFAVENDRIGYRKIEIDPDNIFTSLRYLSI